MTRRTRWQRLEVPKLLFSRYFPFCNVIRLWRVQAILTYRAYKINEVPSPSPIVSQMIAIGVFIWWFECKKNGTLIYSQCGTTLEIHVLQCRSLTPVV